MGLKAVFNSNSPVLYGTNFSNSVKENSFLVEDGMLAVRNIVLLPAENSKIHLKKYSLSKDSKQWFCKIFSQPKQVKNIFFVLPASLWGLRADAANPVSHKTHQHPISAEPLNEVHPF